MLPGTIPGPGHLDQEAGNDSFTTGLWHFDDVDTSTSSPGTDNVGEASSLAHTITWNGAAQIDTAQSVFGGSSVLVDGVNGSYGEIPATTDWDIGSGEFTIDFWVRLATLGGNNGVFCHYTSTTEHLRLAMNTLGQFIFQQISTADGNKIINSNTAITADTWNHIAAVRTGDTLITFINGVNTNTADLTGFTYTNFTGVSYFGQIYANTWILDGWIDEFRFTKGLARWADTFAPPDRAYA